VEESISSSPIYSEEGDCKVHQNIQIAALTYKTQKAEIIHSPGSTNQLGAWTIPSVTSCWTSVILDLSGTQVTRCNNCEHKRNRRILFNSTNDC